MHGSCDWVPRELSTAGTFSSRVVALWPLSPWDPLAARTTGRDHDIGDGRNGPDVEEQSVDVIVVGAGLSGLVAAYELVRAGYNVRVLEARNEAGGRARTLREPFDDGLIAETGPARIPPDHDRTLGYIDHFGRRRRSIPRKVSTCSFPSRGIPSGRLRTCSSVGGGIRGSRCRKGPMSCRWRSPKRSETVCGMARQ